MKFEVTLRLLKLNFPSPMRVAVFVFPFYSWEN